VETLAHRGEEGRGDRRKAPGSGKQAMSRRYPNGATQKHNVEFIDIDERTGRTETS
jgi:hypothetical protein